MAKIARNTKLDSPNARSKLAPSGKPYFQSIDQGLDLGYRKGARTKANNASRAPGRWVLRRYLGNERYAVETFGLADDFSDADGAEVLTFFQAQERARELAKAAKETKPAAGPLTVDAALDAYFDRLEAEHSKSLGDARQRAALHIRPALGEKLVADLSRDELSKWLAGLASAARFVRGKKDEAARALEKANGPEETRRRKASANRILTILKAALNQAFADGKTPSDSAWRAVKPFREVEAARVRYFTADEVRRLVNAAPPDFRALINGALFTGARYGELARLRVGDFNIDSGTVYVAQSKSGRPRHVVLTDEGQAFFQQTCAGRATDELLFRHADGSAWGAAHQSRPMRETCAAARVKPAGFHILRHTAASHYVMAGIPLPVVAQNLGHADTRMTEKHYAHLAPSYVAETIRSRAPTFGTVEKTVVTPIAAGGRH